MPSAGWCRECSEWVWVTPDGGCQNGHEPESVESVHDQEVSTPDRPFGVGLLPLDLNRFSWGAFFLPVFWGLTYGVWPVVAMWGLGIMTPLVLGSLVGTSGAMVTNLIAITVFSEVVAGLARLWAGANANRLLWQRDAIRLQLLPSTSPRFTVEHYSTRQRRWTLWSGIAMVVASVVSIPVAAASWREYGLTVVGPLMPVVWLSAEVMLGLWLNSRMRSEPAAEAKASNSP